MGNKNSGRRPQPTALKVLRGNPGQRKLNKNEVRPPAGQIVKPAWLGVDAARFWDELAPICQAMGTLTVADTVPFAGLCELQATFQQAVAGKAGEGFKPFRFKQEADGAVVEVCVDAVLKLERETANALRPYYEYFGLTPSSRARISAPKMEEKPVSKWAGLK